VATLLPILTILLYLLIGSAFDVRDDGKHSSTQEIDKMVSGLASKLEKEPDNYKGWAMLARSYKVMKRPIESERAFERALPFVEKDPQLLADYADVVATNANGNFSGKPIDLINMALKLDPHHAMSLWLAGSAAFNAEQYQLAIQYWSRLYQLMPADSDDGRSILASINEAREKQNLPILSEIKVAPKNMTLEKSMKNSAITGMVEIDPKLKAKRSNADILMVIARGPDSRMPVAVLRIPSPLLPYKFTLDDSTSMSPEFKISNLKEVNLEVRISKLGQAKLESGDLIGEISFVKVNQKNIKVLINKVQP
jgi:cytochrome c-type biogenesis protein CcmH